ncbi:MAG: nuclear transport factor 2 family protein [Burkholderiaceae bacterium]|nr:nuclear transport factor 2 family protein [Burkholderiaceae bacterium]
MANYVVTWNRHNTAEWADLLADDVWYHETTDRVQRMRGKETVLKFFGDVVTISDIQWDVVQIKEMPDGTVSAVVRHVSGHLPKVNGKYSASFESFPAFTRWRKSGNSWRMFYFTSHKGSALDAMRKDGLE